MAQAHSTPTGVGPQRAERAQLAEILESVDPSAVISRLELYHARGGPKGHNLTALWRAYLASFVLNLPHTNALIRRLQDDPSLRLLCGFSGQFPHRCTFNRFINRLGAHGDLVAGCLASLTDQLREFLPGLGQQVAVDSTNVRSHSNPNRVNKITRQVSDPEASWTAKNSAHGRDKKEWSWGYKLHLVADATYGVPLYGYVTTASRNDSSELPNLLDRAKLTHEWHQPEYVMADRGYDSRPNHMAVSERGGVLICRTRRNANNALYEGIYTHEGVPTCLGLLKMEYIRSDPDLGHLYRCRGEGCHLKDPKGVKHCQDELWENRQDNPRLFGPLRQRSAAWKALYRLRQAVERVFKSMKESRRLERHCKRGLRNISLHALMSVVAYSATVLVQMQAGRQDYRWMVRKVA